MKLDLSLRYVIFVHSREDSIRAQERLFELGFAWRCGGQRIQDYDTVQLHLNYNRALEISYSSAYWMPPKECVPLTLEELMSGEKTPEPAKTMPKPTEYSKWHKSCLAKLILKKWPPTGTLKAAMSIMADEHCCYSEKYLCGYVISSYWDIHPDTPPEIISELKRRASADYFPATKPG